MANAAAAGGAAAVQGFDLLYRCFHRRPPGGCKSKPRAHIMWLPALAFLPGSGREKTGQADDVMTILDIDPSPRKAPRNDIGGLPGPTDTVRAAIGDFRLADPITGE